MRKLSNTMPPLIVQISTATAPTLPMDFNGASST
jgi:hypothetical protein